ncbi:unnamed protein product [Urochloa decumbens]|uniref:Uncharacterized protein n=1 Tax=Urochloa decumbens TaxID=240449 RepID=A0ABC9BER5_9POAL
MLPAVRSVPPGGAGESESGTAWTGEKRRKTTNRPSPLGSSDDDADMDIQHHPPEDDSGLRVYSANDEISDEELDLCLSKVKSRETPIYLPFTTRIYDEERDKLYERFCELRMNDYLKIVKPEDIYVPEGSKYPPEIHMWDDDQYCIFDWTFNNEFYDLAELGDYQRICPTRKAENEYYNWEEYQLTLSSYETDEDYVKYCDELSKRIKWVEEHRHLDNREFSKIKHRGFKQAMKIASEFSHLPYSLAVRGYEEHIWYMRPEMILKDLDKLCFEIWKRVFKQKMDFRQALEDILATNMFPSLSPLIKAEIEGSFCILSMQFEICKEHIPENVELDDLLGKINYVVFESLKPKTYVSYVTKKLEIGRRLQLPSRFPKAVNEQYMDP